MFYLCDSLQFKKQIMGWVKEGVAGWVGVCETSLHWLKGRLQGVVFCCESDNPTSQKAGSGWVLSFPCDCVPGKVKGRQCRAISV